MQRSRHHAVVYYQFERLADHTGLAHGVFTRRGGVSAPPFDTLNVGSTVGDNLAHVRENRARMAAAMSVRDEETRTTWQVHGAEVLVVRAGETPSWPPPKADGIVTADPGVPLVMRFADCVPLFLYDPVKRAIGLAHAGWRGTLAGAGPATVRVMVEAFGSRPQDIIAGIGPSIGPCCYEVGPEVVDAVQRAFHGTHDLILPSLDGGGPHFDLWAANERALRAAGVHQIEVSEMCTYCLSSEFYSHRREQGKTGRFGALIALQETGSMR